MAARKNIFKSVLLTIAQILSIIYSIPLFIFASFTVTGLPGFGDMPPEKIRTGTIFFVSIGLFYLLFPIWLFIRRNKGTLSRKLEFLIAFMSLSPIIFWVLLVTTLLIIG